MTPHLSRVERKQLSQGHSSEAVAWSFLHTEPLAIWTSSPYSHSKVSPGDRGHTSSP